MKPERIAALADGIFAIAMTLLVLDMHVPPVTEALNQGLAALLPQFLSLVISFLILAIYWSSHHMLFARVSKGNMGFMWRNVWFLLSVILVPFATALLAAYPFVHLAQIVYTLLLTACGVLLYSCIFYATHKGNLFAEKPSAEFHRNVAGKVLLPPIVYLIALLVGFWDTRLSLVLVACGPASYFVPIESKAWVWLTRPFAKYFA